VSVDMFGGATEHPGIDTISGVKDFLTMIRDEIHEELQEVRDEVRKGPWLRNLEKELAPGAAPVTVDNPVGKWNAATMSAGTNEAHMILRANDSRRSVFLRALVANTDRVTISPRTAPGEGYTMEPGASVQILTNGPVYGSSPTAGQQVTYVETEKA